MQDCIQACWRCRNECQITLLNHCLPMGGEHVAEDHVKIMMDCIQICQVAADFITRNSYLYAEVCETCAEICDACADSCEEIGGREMERCARICRECADLCREMDETAVNKLEDRGSTGLGFFG
jgi:hypothetical protein